VYRLRRVPDIFLKKRTISTLERFMNQTERKRGVEWSEFFLNAEIFILLKESKNNLILLFRSTLNQRVVKVRFKDKSNWPSVGIQLYYYVH
jgi:hypothetical protein